MALRRATELPLLVRLPYQGAGLAKRAVEAGADALVCIAPPRGMAMVMGASAGGFVEGRLFGPLVRGLAMQTLRETLGELGESQPAVPVIACGGVDAAEDVEMLLAAGASAVMVDSLAWVASWKLNALLARDYGQSK